MAWLDDNPPRIRQFRYPRRRPLSGVIDIHTAESFPDETGPDTGAENVARFIRDRTNYGSYHDICDSDSIIHLVRDNCESFSVGTLNLNHHGYAISAATQAHKWNDLPGWWVDATIRNMANAAARFVKRNNLSVPARWLSADQARREIPGFIRHSVADPDRRGDPGTSFPGNTFFAYYLEELQGEDWFDMATEAELRSVVRGEVNTIAAETVSRLLNWKNPLGRKVPGHDDDFPTLAIALGRMDKRTYELVTRDQAALADAIVSRLSGDEVTVATVKQGVLEAIRELVEE